jgi:hypothetical protein
MSGRDARKACASRSIAHSPTVRGRINQRVNAIGAARIRGHAKKAQVIRYVEHFETAGDAVLRSACRMSLEGIGREPATFLSKAIIEPGQLRTGPACRLASITMIP